MDIGSLLVVGLVVGLIVVGLLVGRGGGGPPHRGTDIRAGSRDDTGGGFGGGGL